MIEVRWVARLAAWITALLFASTIGASSLYAQDRAVSSGEVESELDTDHPGEEAPSETETESTEVDAAEADPSEMEDDAIEVDESSDPERDVAPEDEAERAPLAPLPDRTLEYAVAGTALAVGVAATIAGFVTRMLAERAFDRADTAAPEDRSAWLAEGNALEVASTASWASAGAFVLGGLIGLYFLQAEKDAHLDASYEARRVPVEIEISPSLVGMSARVRF